MAATDRLRIALGQADERARRHIVTPEGVALPVDLAGRGERAAAFAIDVLIFTVALVLIPLLAYLVGLVSLGQGSFAVTKWLWIVLFLVWFLVRSFYFAYFELRWHGSTPGKRIFGLRVIDRAGGALGADAVLARNLMREVEIFLPGTLLLVGAQEALGSLIVLAMLGWMLVLTLMPLFNRDRLRVGDMVGGTWVILAPKVVLLPDLAEAGAQAARPGPAAEPYRFSTKQLDRYGILELQTLEQVLRQDGPNAAAMREEVARRIQRRIGWTADPGLTVDAQQFLQAFYTALRRRLEAQMLFGIRRKDKHDRG
jgi:uncharacterized RDD family membrane protein YckC